MRTADKDMNMKATFAGCSRVVNMATQSLIKFNDYRYKFSVK